MGEEQLSKLSRRERQMMDIIYRRGRASAAEVREGLPDPPSYSAVRTLLTILESKGYVEHVKEGARYIYRPVQRRDRAGRAALRRVMQTFYDGSLGKAVTALVDVSGSRLSSDEIERLERLIEKAREEGR